MLLLTPKTLCPGYELDDVKEDYAASRKAGQYRISRRAFYLPAFPGTRYIPFKAVTRAVLRNAGLPISGCCGRELPVVKLHLDYAGGSGDYVIDPVSQSDTAADMLHNSDPRINFEDRR